MIILDLVDSYDTHQGLESLRLLSANEINLSKSKSRMPEEVKGSAERQRDGITPEH